MNIRRNIILLTLVLVVSNIFGQSLTITDPFRAIPNSSVLALYKNQFGRWEKPDLDDTFPYVVIRVGLDGNGQEVRQAKQMLNLYLGTQTAVESVYTEGENEILFLIPSRARHIEISCGDGCERQTIFDMVRLQSNMVYYGRVHYVPEDKEDDGAPKRQFFKFNVSPEDAIVEIVVNGKTERCHIENGIASKLLNYGSYPYTVTANKYYPEKGVITVSELSTEKDISLRPRFGWIEIEETEEVVDAYVYATNVTTEEVISLGQFPLKNAELSSGSYIIEIQKKKYKTFTQSVTISDGEYARIHPVMLPNYTTVTLQVSDTIGIYQDNQLLGRGEWTGTLEYGENVIETRLTNHRSAYTSLMLKEEDKDKVFVLNEPTPILTSLIIAGEPLNALVYVDGKRYGTTPFIVDQLLIGEHEVRLEKIGYASQSMEVVLNEGEEKTIEYTLQKGMSGQSNFPPMPSIDMLHFMVNGVPFSMVRVAADTCVLGATKEHAIFANEDELPLHQVALSDYYIGQTEVTQAMWEAVMNDNPSETLGLSMPVTNVSWEDCQLFISRLNELTNMQFRLPTEAEWEWAARGGNRTNGFVYAGSDNADEVAWHIQNADKAIHVVAEKLSNELGVYDMCGNVLEWCSDWYGGYKKNFQENPTGASSGTERVVRGGSINTTVNGCRVSSRDKRFPTFSLFNVGFRLAL